jgi:hypothetical protein
LVIIIDEGALPVIASVECGDPFGQIRGQVLRAELLGRILHRAADVLVEVNRKLEVKQVGVINVVAISKQERFRVTASSPSRPFSNNVRGPTLELPRFLDHLVGKGRDEIGKRVLDRIEPEIIHAVG